LLVFDIMRKTCHTSSAPTTGVDEVIGTDEVQVSSTTVLLLLVEVTVITSPVSVLVASASVLSLSSTISSSESIDWVLELLNSSNVLSGF